jgi:hypothetical protein
MRYTYLFTQISREENGNLVPVTDKPNKFIFTFGKEIETFLKSPDNTVLLKKDMWKENPATNKEILPCVCFSVPSKKGYRRPLVMSKDADKRAGVYKYELVYKNEIKYGDYLSEDIRRLTETFVNGVRSVNSNTMTIPWLNLKNANVKYLMSYIKSYVYEQLLQDKDKLGKARSDDYLKKVLETLFSLIPDTIIEKFDKGLEAHDAIRAKLEGVPKDDTATYKAVLKSQNYFETVDDFNLFVVLRDFILRVKNNFNHLVWAMYRSKIGLVSLKNVKKQLGDIFGFVSKVQDDYELKDKYEILKVICGGDRYCKDVKGFLEEISSRFDVEKMNRTHRAALCYKFMKECNLEYLGSKFKRNGQPYRQEQFRDLCLRYWGIEEKNTLRPNKCQHLMEEFSSYLLDKEVWGPMSKNP